MRCPSARTLIRFAIGPGTVRGRVSAVTDRDRGEAAQDLRGESTILMSRLMMAPGALSTDRDLVEHLDDPS